MGCGGSVFYVDRPDVFCTIQHHVIFRVSPSQAYNFFQESLIHPRRYIFFDTRGREEYNDQSLWGAAWAWDQYDSNFMYGFSGSMSPMLGGTGSLSSPFLSAATSGSPLHQQSSGANPYYCFLREASDGRTVVAFTEKTDNTHLMEFLQHLVVSGAEIRLICVISGGLAAMRMRYQRLLTTNALPYSGPVEILSPNYRKVKVGVPALFVSGVDVLLTQVDSIRHFGVSVVVNISSVSVRMLPGLKVITYTSKFGTPDLVKAARCIGAHLQREAVLVVDDRHGREYASAACVAHLVREGVPTQLAIQYVKERKPSADKNHLMAIHSLLALKDTTGHHSKLARSFRYNGVGQVGVPMECLDRWDERDGLEEEEISEVVIEAPPPGVIPTATVSPAEASAALAAPAPGKRTIRFEMKQFGGGIKHSTGPQADQVRHNRQKKSSGKNDSFLVSRKQLQSSPPSDPPGRGQIITPRVSHSPRRANNSWAVLNVDPSSAVSDDMYDNENFPGQKGFSHEALTLSVDGAKSYNFDDGKPVDACPYSEERNVYHTDVEDDAQQSIVMYEDDDALGFGDESEGDNATEDIAFMSSDAGSVSNSGDDGEEEVY